jgi:putative membrane protein
MRFTTASTSTGTNNIIVRRVYPTLFFLLWIWTFVNTSNVSNWMIENVLTVAFLALIFGTASRFRFSDLSYTMAFVYICLHILGAQHTYAETPIGYWIQNTFGLARNPYDRIVHFSFGLLLAYPLRDYFKNKLKWPTWVCWVLPAEITLSFSGMYELIEYGVADIFFPSMGTDYLGTQGDPWDAQKDMAMAFMGAILTQLFTSIARRFRGASPVSIPVEDPVVS